MPYLVVVRGSNVGQRFPLTKSINTIGRNPDSEVVLGANAVSREHARIHQREDQYYLEDLNSRNLTFVNDVKVSPGKLVPLAGGDRIRICDFTCEFVNDAAPASRVGEDTGTVISSMQASSANLLAAQPAERLRLLLEISNNLAHTVEIEALLPRILDSLFQLFRQADRGFILVQDESRDALIPKVVKARRERDSEMAAYSRTILNQCVAQGRAILIEDTAEDKDMQLAASITDSKVRSIIAAPMISSEGSVLGVIQIDTRDRQRRFTQDDLLLLAAVANQAAVALDNAMLHEDLAERQKVQREIELAKEVQRCFLPQQLPSVAGYEFFAHYQAARSVGGDFYGFLDLGQGRIAISVGDVAGKGVPAALLMARISGDVKFALLAEGDPGRAVMKMNHLFHQSGIQDRFVAYLLALLDPQTGVVAMVNAGQVPPLVRRGDGTVQEDACQGQNGLPLGITDDSAYQPCLVNLSPGDCLLLCTDGITDAADSQQRPFGKERLIEAIQTGGPAAPALGAHIIRRVSDYVGGAEQFDDMTMVCLSRRAD
jgi:sigma-B regulation protein RsbU (phosphoserine phosphatase)